MCVGEGGVGWGGGGGVGVDSWMANISYSATTTVRYAHSYSSFQDDITAYLRFHRRHYDTPRMSM